MSKKKAIKVLGAAAVAASAFAVTAPTQAASNVDALVKKAVDAGTVLKWAISVEGSADGTTRPYAQYNAAKDALKAAKAAVASLPAAQKEAKLAQLDKDVQTHITRTMHYIDAITAGEKMEAKQAVVEAQIEKGLIDDATETAYHELSKEIRKQAVLLDRVYGQSTRDAIRDQYKEAAQDVRDSVQHAVTVKIELDLANKALAAKDFDKVEKHLAEANKYIGDVKNAEMKKTLTAGIEAVEAELTPAVKSVSVVNAKEVVVTFNTALAENTTDVQLLSAFTFGNKTDSKAVLSKDRKTVTYTLDTTEVSNAKITVAALDTAKKDSKGVAIKTAEYNSLVTFEDKVAPAVTSVEAKNTTSVITFSEPVKSEGTVSLNGVAITSPTGYELSADGKTLTVKNLEAEKSYKVDIVGATDFSSNIANPIAVNFTVAKPVVDNSKPTVTSSVSGTEITLDFSEELAKQNLDLVTGDEEYAKVTVGSTVFYLKDAQQDTDDKTKFTLDASSALGSEKFLNANVKVEGFKDEASNAGDKFEFAALLQKDTTAPKFVSASSKMLAKDDSGSSDVDAVYLTFDEEVTVTGKFTLKTKNDVVYTSAPAVALSAVKSGVDVDGNGKVEGSEKNTVKVAVDLDENSTYTFVLDAKAVADADNNKIEDALTVSFTSGKFTPAAGTVTDSLVLASVNPVVVVDNNVFTVEYAANVSNSALTATNYTLGGKALPANTKLQFVDGTKKVRVTLPEASITANGNYILEAKNVVDTDGNTLKDGKATATITLKENIAPTASKVNVVNSKTFTVDFSEVIADQASPTGVTVKIAGTTVTPSAASVSGGKLTVTTTNDFALTDSISVELKDTNLVDANGNKVKNGVVTK